MTRIGRRITGTGCAQDELGTRECRDRDSE
jgi:hypothetical protein